MLSAAAKAAEDGVVTPLADAIIAAGVIVVSPPPLMKLPIVVLGDVLLAAAAAAAAAFARSRAAMARSRNVLCALLNNFTATHKSTNALTCIAFANNTRTICNCDKNESSPFVDAAASWDAGTPLPD